MSEQLFYFIGTIGMIVLWPYLMGRFNILFTIVREGEGRFVVSGQSYVKFVFSLRGHIMSPDGNVVHGDSSKGILEWLYGVYWVGFPPFRTIYRYSLRWTSYRPTGENGEKSPVLHDDNLDSVYLKDKAYYGLMPAEETSEGIPLRIQFLATLRVVNPYKAIFLVDGWVETVIDRISQQGRVYVGQKTYKDLLTGETSDPRQGFSGFLFDTGIEGAESLESFILRTYGVQFVSCDFISIDPIGNYREETTRAYIAQQTAAAIAIKAEADAAAIRATGQAEADMIAARGNAEAAAIRERSDAYNANPAAAQAILDAEVGKAQGIPALAKSLLQAITGGRQ